MVSLKHHKPLLSKDRGAAWALWYVAPKPGSFLQSEGFPLGTYELSEDILVPCDDTLHIFNFSSKNIFKQEF